jgi:hypothetical protein
MLQFEYNPPWDSCYTGYYYIHTWPLIGKPGILKGQGDIHSCREFYVRSYRHKIVNNNTHTVMAKRAFALVTYGNKAKSESDFEKRVAKLKSDSLKGLYIINSFEKHHNWPLTKLYDVECATERNRYLPLVFFSGCRKWTMSPYLLSIWCLAIRLGRNQFVPKQLFDLSHEDIVRQLAIAANTCSSGDGMQLRKSIREWDNLMILYKDMFGSENRKYHWALSHLNGGSDRPEGIMKLITGTTYYKELHKKFFELKKEKNLI